jgi:hypothetical protein
LQDVSTRVQPSLSPRSDPRGPSPHRWRVLSGSRQDEVMENLSALGSKPRRLLARSRSCRAVIRARSEMTKSTPREPAP